ncbi:MAG: hypothetical protein WAT52_08075 [Chitinophagales bacterium]
MTLAIDNKKPKDKKVNNKYKPAPSPRLKQLYFKNYMSLESQYSVRWKDRIKVGLSTTPGLFLHATCFPQFCKLKSVDRWPLLTLIGLNILETYLSHHFSNSAQIAELYHADIKVIRKAIKWCSDGNYITRVNYGYRGIRPIKSTKANRYVLTLKGQEILNEYYLFCHQYFDTQIENLQVSDVMKKYSY